MIHRLHSASSKVNDPSIAERAARVGCPEATSMTVPSMLEPVRPTSRWAIIVAATVVSTCALDVVATAAGALLAASHILDGARQAALLGFLAATYVAWFAGLRVNVIANWRLLEQTGLSTNLLSKSMFELARRRSSSRCVQRAASAAGYIATEIAKEAPYYAGAFGAALLSDTVSSTDALVFLAGTNLGAALYEYGVAWLSRAFLARRTRTTALLRLRASSPETQPVTRRVRRSTALVVREPQTSRNFVRAVGSGSTQPRAAPRSSRPSRSFELWSCSTSSTGSSSHRTEIVLRP